MTGRRWRATLGTVAAIVAGGSPAAAQDFEWSHRMDGGQILEIRGITGSVLAERAPGATARVTARKRGRPTDLDEVEIRMSETPDGYTVCAIYGRPANGTDCRDPVGHDDHENRNRSIDVEVEFVVQVPAGVEFIGTMVTGDVRAEDLESDVTATSVTGDVVVSTTGSVRANSVSGDLDIEAGRLVGNQRFHTVSGDITLYLPPDVDADLRFESLSGDLDADFDLDVSRDERRWVGSRVRATLGDGGPSLVLKTVSGDVRLRRSRFEVR